MKRFLLRSFESLCVGGLGVGSWMVSPWLTLTFVSIVGLVVADRLER